MPSAASRARLHCAVPLASGRTIELPPGAARHVQVLRLQPGDAVTLFDGNGGEFEATIARMGRSNVKADVGVHHDIEREASRAIHLAVGMPANERMDWLVEKATELGAASLQPLLTERSVLRLSVERAAKKQQHWQGIAAAACEQCGRNRLPEIRVVTDFDSWLGSLDAGMARLLLSPRQDAAPLGAGPGAGPAVVLSGPEGGLTPAEEAAALANGFMLARLGPRILRAETAPLVALALLTLSG